MPAIVSNNDTEAYEGAVVSAIQQLTKRVDASERHADEERDKLRQYVEDAIQLFRKDVHLTTAEIQMRALDHDRQHGNDRIERIKRQWVLDAWLIVLTILGLANIILASYLIGRGH